MFYLLQNDGKLSVDLTWNKQRKYAEVCDFFLSKPEKIQQVLLQATVDIPV